MQPMSPLNLTPLVESTVALGGKTVRVGASSIVMSKKMSCNGERLEGRA